MEHVVLYSEGSLKMVMDRFGFQPVSVKSFGANAHIQVIPEPYKSAYDSLAKQTNNGATQLGYFKLMRGESN